MKRTGFDHPKITRLASALSLELWGARGIVESIAHFTARHAIRGDVGKWTNHDIAQGIGWKGDPDALIAALVASGWLDEHKTHRLIVHDWHDHADDSTRKTLRNRKEEFATLPEDSGNIPEESRKGRPKPEPEPGPEPEPNSGRPVGPADFDLAKVDRNKATAESSELLKRLRIKTHDDPKNRRLVVALAAISQAGGRFEEAIRQTVVAYHDKTNPSNPWGYLKGCAKKRLEPLGINLNAVLDRIERAERPPPTKAPPDPGAIGYE